MSAKDGSVLDGYQGASCRALDDDVAVVPVQGVPGDHEAVDVHAEWPGPLHRDGCAVTDLADAEGLPAVVEGDLDGPAHRVPADQIGWAAGQVGGDQDEHGGFRFVAVTDTEQPYR
jgi:hypothetical protein